MRKDNRFYIVYSDDEYNLPVGLFTNCSELADFFGKTTNAMFVGLRNCKCDRQSSIERLSDKKKFIVKRWILENGEAKEY